MSPPETWTYNGGWQLVHVAGRPRPISHVVRDETRGRLRAIGLLYQRGLAFLEQSATPAESTAYGVGCGNPSPPLYAATRPRVGAADVAVETRAAPGSVVGIGLSFVQRTPPGACDLLIGPLAASLIVVADARGFAAMPLPIPAVLDLRGVAVFGQSAAIDPLTNNVTLSRGLRLTVGD